MKRLLWMAIAAILFLLFLTGCESWNTWLRERDFELAISNRMNTPIQVAIDGEWTATIASQDILNLKIKKK